MIDSLSIQGKLQPCRCGCRPWTSYVQIREDIWWLYIGCKWCQKFTGARETDALKSWNDWAIYKTANFK